MSGRLRWSLAFCLATACSGTVPEDAFSVSPGGIDDDVKTDSTAGPRAELKVTVDPTAISEIRDYMGLDGDLAEEREIWFYDTGALDLFESGAVLRARKIKDDDDDSTVKMRPLTADQVDPSWFGTEGFKCETDMTPGRTVSSCSLTVVQDRGEIDDVGDGERAIDKLFSSEQELFVAELGPPFDWSALIPLGPVEVQVWKIETSSLPSKLAAERWQLPDGDLLELSMKVPLADAEQGLADFLVWLDDRDIPLSAVQETKTRRALEHFRSTMTD